MAKKTDNSTIRNKRATFDYDLKDTFIAGVSLTGAETRSLREKHGSLQGSFVQIKNDEVWLVNSLVTPLKTNAANLTADIQSRDRKLLLKRREIKILSDARKQGNTIVPIKFLTKGRFIKVEIAIAKGKRKYDKRASIKRREQDIEARRELKSKYN